MYMLCYIIGIVLFLCSLGGPRFSIAHNPAIYHATGTGPPPTQPYIPPGPYYYPGGVPSPTPPFYPPVNRFPMPPPNLTFFPPPGHFGGMMPAYPGQHQGGAPQGAVSGRSSTGSGKQLRKRSGRQMVGFYPAMEKPAKQMKVSSGN